MFKEIERENLKNKKGYMKLITLVIVCIFIINTNVVYASDTHEDFLEEASILKELGLFVGSDLGFELNRYGSRIEAAVIIVRLLGVENVAMNYNYEHPYTDVPSWAKAYVGFLYHEGLTVGIGDGKYGSDMNLSPNQFLTFALRSLSYDDNNGDFNWNEAVKKSVELGILNIEYAEYLNKNTNIYRDDMIAIMYNLLNQKFNNKEISLIDFLIGRRVTTLEKAMALGVYKQVQNIKVTGELSLIDQSHKGVITETENGYHYYVIVPFGPNEEPYNGVIKLISDGVVYECVITKEAYFTNDIYQNLVVGETISLTGEFATNILENNEMVRSIIIK